MNLVFDLETNGLLRDLTQIHCLCIHDLDEATTQVFNDQGGDKEPINRGITYLQDADHIIGHNVIGFDCPAISKLYGFLIVVLASLILYFSAGYFMLTFLP